MLIRYECGIGVMAVRLLPCRDHRFDSDMPLRLPKVNVEGSIPSTRSSSSTEPKVAKSFIVFFDIPSLT